MLSFSRLSNSVNKQVRLGSARAFHRHIILIKIWISTNPTQQNRGEINLQREILPAENYEKEKQKMLIIIFIENSHQLLHHLSKKLKITTIFIKKFNINCLSCLKLLLKKKGGWLWSFDFIVQMKTLLIPYEP